ncbi:hypothetical protein [Streptomyces sp. NRRL S-87]|uniref:hypothetical protein n=1 Tax=Streptomyces sp. NRRL S-87 TaxID=1463920 RepID=UPI000ACDF14E|nr:hypothetical protein [Streptomyces sp. NRRL S-87]
MSDTDTATQAPDATDAKDAKDTANTKDTADTTENGYGRYEAYGYVSGADFGYGYRSGPEAPQVRQLWAEEPKARRRMPDPVRESAVRAVLLISVALILGSVTVLFSVTGSWLAFPVMMAAIAATVVATWGVADVWVTRQMWNQRYGVLSEPSSSARRSRRERRRARKAAKAAERAGGGLLKEA